MAETSTSTARIGAAEETAARLLAVVRELVEELHPRRGPGAPVTLDSALDRDLGLDSLSRVEAMARIERAFGVVLPEAVFANAETPRDLLRALAAAGEALPAAVARESAAPALGQVESLPAGAATLVEVLDWHVRVHPDRPHVRFANDGGEEETLTYGQLKESAVAVAAGLQAAGLEPGDAAMIMLPTGKDYLASFFGILLAGGVPVPIYPPGRIAQIEEHFRRHAAIASNCRAIVLVTMPEAVRFAHLLRSQVESVREVVTAADLAARGATFAAPALKGGDVAFIQYTSGSTGNPKGVVLTHANLLANIRAMGKALDAHSGDVFVSWLPLYHDMGLIGAWLGNLYHASLLVLMSPLSFLARPERWLTAIHRHRATISGGPNFAYELCARRLDDRQLAGLDLSSWRVAFNGAEAVGADTIERFCRRFAPCGFRREAMMPVYGLAESSVGLAFPPHGRGPVVDRIRRERLQRSGVAEPARAGERDAITLVACGSPLPGHQIRIVDAAGRELPERREGRLQFLGPSATSGYFRNPEETRRLFDGPWLNSGDLAYVAGGDVYITGRSKDIIIRGGRNIYPAELEDAVGEIAGVRKGAVAVFGSADAASGTERLVVVAETRKLDAAEQERLRAAVNGVVTALVGGPPDDVALMPPRSVPKTSSGKVRRVACRELYESGGLGRPGPAVWIQIARVMLAGLGPRLRRAGRIAAETLYGLYAWAILLAIAVVAWPLAVALPSAAARWASTRGAARLLAWATGTAIRVQGIANLPPAGRPCVVVSNHASYIDGTVLVAALGQALAFVAKAELARQLVAGPFLKRLGAEFVERFDREKGVEDAARLSAAARAGRSLLFFAEGTLQRTPGLLPFYLGPFVVAAEAGVPVVPVALRGTRSKLREGTVLARPGAVAVVVCPPIELAPEERSRLDSWQAALRLRDLTRAEILRHLGEPDLAHERVPLEPKP